MWARRAVVFLLFTGVAAAQDLVGSRAGLITYTQGDAAIGTTRSSHGRYVQVLDGETLYTRSSLVEMQLSAEALARCAPETAFRISSGALEDTETVLVTGSVIVEITKWVPGIRIRIRSGDWVVEPLKEGIYRLDSSPPRVRIYGGEARVEGNQRNRLLKRGQMIEFTNGSETSFNRKEALDPLQDWSATRSFQVFSARSKNRRWDRHWQYYRGKFWHEDYRKEMP